MGFLDGLSVGPGGFSRPSQHRRHSSRSLHKKHRSRSRSRSRSSSRRRGRAPSFAGSLFGGMGDADRYQKHNSSRGSLFGLGNSSRSSFFGIGGRPSYYKRSPRQGFMQRSYRQLKRLLRDLVHYAKNHPWKVFFLVVMPLVTGGALTALLARFGLRMPPSLERMLGMASRAAAGNGIGLVGDAVRMAGDFGASGARVERGRGRGRGGGNDGWGDGVMGVAKRFL
ncbi:Uncharacterized protein TCAP_00470 [Tolypocladium capitatum]|uniref:Uncharacterized protein n=1 Tax=Tolypocladium capitatum TaxID=45235 RepID=A0A2K3QQ09_9HYPO|nr:Uncharacterized protein TCAP_00470 [Tolypocladium capitatum]